MKWIDAVKEIREAQENNRLVIFVGSGVSKNSDIPTWQELIDVFADKIGYNNQITSYIEPDTDSVSTDSSGRKYSQEELLRIPEYYYLQDSSDNKDEYFKLIDDTLYSDNGPNPIDDEVFNIMPHHIITTNFDTLLEESTVLNSKFYSVVSKDSDLLSRAEDRYLIKMHGDLKNSRSLVLKESDYIVYEQNHPLISTFIRALLVNHTFLFIGYSLNDYNLNLIIGWINYFCEIHGITDRPKNFMVQEKSPSEYEEDRLKNKNIFVVDLSAMPEEFVGEIAKDTTLESNVGKKLFSFLHCVANKNILQRNMPLKDILVDSYKVLQSYRFISIGDLRKVYSFGGMDFSGTTLSIIKQEKYNSLLSLMETPDGSEEIHSVFNRTILTSISYRFGEKRFYLEPKQNDIYFQLYLDNNYQELEKQLEFCSDTATKIYYYHFIRKSISEIKPILSLEEKQILKDDFVAILLHKMRDRIATMTIVDRQIQKTEELRLLFDTAPIKYKPAIEHLKMMFESDAKDKQEMNKKVERQEGKYTFRSTKWFSEHDFKCVWDIQSYAYNYYFFIKKNGIPVDYFSDMRDYLYHYIKVILCSYAPTSAAENDGSFFSSDYPLKSYPINEIDFDIIIKYIRPDYFRNLLEKYSVLALEITGDFNICQKYINLCNAIPEYSLGEWCDHLYNFNIVLCFLKFDNDTKKELFAAFINMLEQSAVLNSNLFFHLFDALEYLVNHFILESADKLFQELIKLITEKSVFEVIIQRYKDRYVRLLKKLSSYNINEIEEKLVDLVDSANDNKDKVNSIMLFQHLLPMERYSKFLLENLSLVGEGNIFYLLINKYIKYNDEIGSIFLTAVESKAKLNETCEGIKSYPSNEVAFTLEHCMILKLLGFEINLDLFKPYKEYSVQLQFMLDPDGFDYALVDTGNYMWQNLIFNSNYKNYFKQHKPELISDELKNIFARKVETREQQKIVYGILLDENELSSF